MFGRSEGGLMSVVRTVVVLCVVTMAAMAEQREAEIALTPAEKSKVDAMNVALREVGNPGKAGKTFEGIALIHGTVDEVVAVLQDRERYSEFMPNVAKVEVTDKEPRGRANFTLKLPLGKIKRYRVEYWDERVGTAAQLFWKLIPWEGEPLPESETIVDTTGYWTIRPSEKEGYALVFYHVYTDPGKIPTGLGWIVDILTRDSLPDLLKGLRKRVETVYHAKPK